MNPLIFALLRLLWEVRLLFRAAVAQHNGPLEVFYVHLANVLVFVIHLLMGASVR